MYHFDEVGSLSIVYQNYGWLRVENGEGWSLLSLTPINGHPDR